MGPEWKSKYLCTLLVAAHLWVATRVVPALETRTGLVFVAYACGATLTQALFLAVHELSHNLFFHDSRWNRAFAIFANLPLVFPFAIAFRGYHLEHHKHQGTEGVDTDLPSHLEMRLVRGPATKSIWLMCQILAYAIRPVLVRRQPWTTWHTVNCATQIVFDAWMVLRFGTVPVSYLVGCLVLAGGLHPCSGHFLSEHYLLFGTSTQETFSYYGPLNWLTWNVGYHNEHHDFSYVPWSRLPQLNRAAPEFYDSLAHCSSWTGALVRYVRDPACGPWSRVRRARRVEQNS